MKVADICRLQDISVKEAEQALASLQDKGLITGFVPGDLDTDIRITEAASPYITRPGE